jgi:hypothetical protein
MSTGLIGLATYVAHFDTTLSISIVRRHGAAQLGVLVTAVLPDMADGGRQVSI